MFVFFSVQTELETCRQTDGKHIVRNNSADLPSIPQPAGFLFRVVIIVELLLQWRLDITGHVYRSWMSEKDSAILRHSFSNRALGFVHVWLLRLITSHPLNRWYQYTGCRKNDITPIYCLIKLRKKKRHHSISLCYSLERKTLKPLRNARWLFCFLL